MNDGQPAWLGSRVDRTLHYKDLGVDYHSREL